MSSAAPDTLDRVPAPKADPEQFELRGRPVQPIRFKRRMIIGSAAIGATALAGTIWLSLRPHASAPIEEAPFHEAKGPAETVKGLPADYSGVPKLGPPLPGDLGRPILDRQHQLAAQGDGKAPVSSQPDARVKRLEDIKTARQSQLLFGTPVPAAGGALPSATAGDAAASPPAPSGADLDPDPNAQSRKLAFSAAVDTKSDANPNRVIPPASRTMISAGSVIPASLITGLRSDLPGLVTAQITENVFDSASGHTLLIPQGARLIGAYDSVIAFGQSRALVVWQRIVWPDGSSIRLDNEPATDQSGYGGVADQVNYHTWALLKGVAISTLLGAGTSVSLTGESDLVQAIRESAQQNAANAGNQITARNLQVQPTITIRPGFRIVLLVHRDLVLKPWRG
jgi:type IV secretory pathway VirB10-like protein